MRANNKAKAIIFCGITAAILICFSVYSHLKQNQKSPEYLTATADTKPLIIPQAKVLAGRVLKIPILMYHHVGEAPVNATGTRADLTVPTVSFAQEVSWLADQGYTSIGLSDLYSFSQGKFAMPKKPVIFTFDDGYQDVFVNAAPILKRYGFFGSFAIITQFVGTTQNDNVYASWDQIKSAYQSGSEIVSHTQTHFDGTNPKFSAEFIYQNLTGSVADIASRLGFNTSILVYPYGHYNQTYIAQAQKAGFVMGVTVHEGSVVNLDDLMQVPRIRVHGAETLDEFEKIITE
jgi:peptidoglycan/xylan/chitin deacetylase (PgdA/CDA1 family)